MSIFLQTNDDIIELSDSELDYSESESDDKNKDKNMFNLCDFCEDNEIEFSCQTCSSRICYSCRSRCDNCMETICPDCETDDYLCESCLDKNDKSSSNSNSSSDNDNDLFEHTDNHNDETDEDNYSDLDE